MLNEADTRAKLIDRAIHEAGYTDGFVRRTATLATSLRDTPEAQKALKSLETTRNRKHRELFDAQNSINAHVTNKLRGQKNKSNRGKVGRYFAIRWKVC